MIARRLDVGPVSTETGSVLVVDDDSLAQAYIKRLLTPMGYQVLSSLSGEEALDRLKGMESPPEVIVLDVHMGGLSGLDVLRSIKGDVRLALIPVLVVTGDKDYELEALRLGASDFISKPFQAAEMRARVQTQVRMSQAIRAMEHAEDLLVTLANVVEARDAYTESHTRHVAALSEAVGRAMGLDCAEDLRVLRLGGYLHDLGKIAISDSILVKPGPLTEEEWVLMRSHPMVGHNLLQPLRTLRDILPTILHHHERWDGSGYPSGLRGKSIPLSARVVGIADCYDAVTTDRPYRKALPHERAVAILQDETQELWDPDVLDAFLDIVESPSMHLPLHAAAI